MGRLLLDTAAKKVWELAVRLGSDLVHVPRFARLMAEQPNFIERVFSQEELRATDQALDPQHIAGLFAAKEAVLKATGQKAGQWFNVKVTHAKNGAPQVSLRDQPDVLISISISHDGEYAQAVAICD